MFIDLLKDADEKWVVYSIIDGHFPSDGELLQVLAAPFLPLHIPSEIPSFIITYYDLY